MAGAAYSALTRPWWPETEADRRWRSRRLLLTGPVGGLLGIAFGILFARRWSLSQGLFALLGAIGGVLGMHLVGHLESYFHHRFPERGAASTILSHIGADVLGGAAAGALFALVLGTDAAASLAVGASLLLAYSWVATRLLLGTFVDDFVGIFTGQAAWARGPDYSLQASLAARGLVDEALRGYEEASDARPRDAQPRLLAAAMLREAGRHEEAVEWLRRALAVPRMDGRRASILTRHIWDICADVLDEPEIAAADLAALLERFPDEEGIEWAREALDRAQRHRTQ